MEGDALGPDHLAAILALDHVPVTAPQYLDHVPDRRSLEIAMRHRGRDLDLRHGLVTAPKYPDHVPGHQSPEIAMRHRVLEVFRVHRRLEESHKDLALDHAQDLETVLNQTNTNPNHPQDLTIVLLQTSINLDHVLFLVLVLDHHLYCKITDTFTILCTQR